MSAIELTQVTKRYGALTAVKGISLVVNEGECLGLIGPNGAGKTTTFSMIAGYTFPSEGSLRVLGVNPSSSGALKGKVGALPQDAALPGVRVGDLLTYWGELSGVPNAVEEARRVLAIVGLGDTWTQLASQLSHGMSKRIALAQALMGEPPLLLLDEPTAGLDPRVAADVRALVAERKGKQTIVISSHNLQELEQLCDTAAILDKGTLVQSGSLDTLTAQDAEFRVLFARGNPTLEPLTLLGGVQFTVLESAGVLLVRYSPTKAQPEDVISDVLGAILAQGVRVTGVTRGKRLETRVLELTGPGAR